MPCRPGGPVVGDLHLVAVDLEKSRQAPGQVLVVVDDEDACATVSPPVRASVAGLDGAETAARAAGSLTVNSLPLPGPSLLAMTVPPCSSVSFRTSVKPMPSPPAERSSDRSPCTKSSNTLGSCSGVMPTPVSRTLMTISLCSRCAVNQICPSLSVYLAAFESRLTAICSSLVGSASRMRSVPKEVLSRCCPFLDQRADRLDRTDAEQDKHRSAFVRS